jgi:GMP synthase-like glutamine amidotransferase
MNVLILQHIACEPPGVYEDVLRERGARLVRVELDEGEPLPDWRDFDAIVAMGGPMGVYEMDAHPWLRGEVDAIGQAVNAGVPFFGACLGVQLLAAALGARVYPGPEPEVGVLEVSLTPDGREDPVTGGLPGAFPSLQWHGDTFDLPDGAVRLLESASYPNQAFRWGPTAYGVQFHIEVDEAMGDEWSRIPEYAAYADRVLGPGGAEDVLADLAREMPVMQQLARGVFERWLDLS